MKDTKKIIDGKNGYAERMEKIKGREENKQEIIRAASQELLQNCNLVRERGNISKSIIQEASKALVELYRQIKRCPLLSNPKWDCNKLDSIDLEKGKEKYCHCEDFLSCPGFDHYFTYKLAEIHAKMKLKMKKKKNQKEIRHK